MTKLNNKRPIDWPKREWNHVVAVVVAEREGHLLSSFVMKVPGFTHEILP